MVLFLSVSIFFVLAGEKDTYELNIIDEAKARRRSRKDSVVQLESRQSSILNEEEFHGTSA
jgi:hypothetical protein